MFDWFRPVVGNYSINTKCSNTLCNKSVIVPAQINDNAVVYCDDCKSAMSGMAREGLYETAKGTPISKLKQIKPHYKWSWKLNKAVRL